MASQMSSLFLVVIFCFVAVYATSPILIYSEVPLIENLKNVNNDVATEIKRLKTLNEVKPVKYEIDITVPKNFNNKEFTATVKIFIKSDMKSNKSIFLHFVNTDIGTYTLQKTTSTTKDKVTITPIQDAEQQMIQLPLLHPNEIEANTEYIIEAKYKGKLQDEMKGFYISTYKNKDNQEEYVLATQFQPTHARKFIPCFDEPEYKVPFTLTLTYPKEYKALFNTKPIADSTSEEDGLVTVTFENTPAMSTYLLALVISKFNNEEKGINSTVWHRFENTLNLGKYAKDQSSPLLTAMNTFTGFEFKDQLIGKVDHVALPDFSAGAMENWGLVTYRESLLLYDKEESPLKIKQEVCTIMAHELSHFWFGNLKTTKWWDTTWLNEGFARYFEYFAAHKVEPEWELDHQFVVQQHLAVMNADSLPTSLPLNYNPKTTQEIDEKFSSITYNKGASIIRMMKYFSTETKFNQGLKNYIKDTGPTVEPKNVWNAMKDIKDNTLLPETTVEQIMDTYVTQPGLPLLTVNLDDGKLKISQKRFMLTKSTEKEKKEERYFVPISYTTYDEHGALNFDQTQPKQWLSNKENEIVEIALKDKTAPVIVNVQASAYARVNYDERLWRRINTILKNDFSKIHKINRAQIVDDVLNLARAEELTYEQALDTISYLEKEKSYYPWYSALNGFQFLLRRLPNSEELKMFISQLLAKVYTDPDVEDEKDHVKALKTRLIESWRCKLGNKDCINKMKEEFEHLKQGHEINADIRSTAYCVAVKDKPENFDYLFERYKIAILYERNLILGALGCSEDTRKLKEYLEETINSKSKIRSQDAALVFTSVATGSSVGVTAATEFLKKHHAQVATSYGSMNALSSILNILIDSFSTEEQITQFRRFLIDDEPQFAALAEKLLISAEKNVEWINKNKEIIETYAEKHLKKDKPKEDEKEKDKDKKPGAAGSAIANVFLIVCSVLIILPLKP